MLPSQYSYSSLRLRKTPTVNTKRRRHDQITVNTVVLNFFAAAKKTDKLELLRLHKSFDVHEDCEVIPS